MLFLPMPGACPAPVSGTQPGVPWRYFKKELNELLDLSMYCWGPGGALYQVEKKSQKWEERTPLEIVGENSVRWPGPGGKAWENGYLPSRLYFVVWIQSTIPAPPPPLQSCFEGGLLLLYFPGSLWSPWNRPFADGRDLWREVRRCLWSL